MTIVTASCQETSRDKIEKKKCHHGAHLRASSGFFEAQNKLQSCSVIFRADCIIKTLETLLKEVKSGDGIKDDSIDGERYNL